MLATVAPKWPKAFTSIGFGCLFIFLALTFWSTKDLLSKAPLLEEITADIEVVGALTDLSTLIGEQLLDAAEQERFEPDFILESANTLGEMTDRLGQLSERLAAENGVIKGHIALRMFNLNFPTPPEEYRLVFTAAFIFIAYVVGEFLTYIGRIVGLWGQKEIKLRQSIAKLAKLNLPILNTELDLAQNRLNLSFAAIGCMLAYSIIVLLSLFVFETSIGSVVWCVFVAFMTLVIAKLPSGSVDNIAGLVEEAIESQ